MNELSNFLSEILTPIVRAAVKSAMSNKEPEQQSQPSHLVDIREAARITGFAVNSIYQMSSAGKIPSKKVGRKLLFDVADLHEWVNAGGRV